MHRVVAAAQPFTTKPPLGCSTCAAGEEGFEAGSRARKGILPPPGPPCHALPLPVRAEQWECAGLPLSDSPAPSCSWPPARQAGREAGGVQGWVRQQRRGAGSGKRAPAACTGCQPGPMVTRPMLRRRQQAKTAAHLAGQKDVRSSRLDGLQGERHQKPEGWGAGERQQRGGSWARQRQGTWQALLDGWGCAMPPSGRARPGCTSALLAVLARLLALLPACHGTMFRAMAGGQSCGRGWTERPAGGRFTRWRQRRAAAAHAS